MADLVLNVKAAQRSDHLLVKNLLNHYVYDMSEWFKFDPDDNGFFSYDVSDTDSKNQRIFIAKYGESPAGLALIAKDNDQFDMKEFFVLRRYRGTGTAQMFFSEILNRQPGNWQVRVFSGNKPAVPFWKRAISNCTNGQYVETHLEIDGKPWIHYHFQDPTTGSGSGETGA